MIEMLIEGRARDLGDGFTVSRVLPYARRRSVGPFIFFDRMGPVTFAPGQGLDVRPHPHIGLATVTYLFEGRIMHRDSVGSVQAIEPGAVNWMTAGRGIVHSERSTPEDRAAGQSLHGIQAWVALPRSHEEGAPDFTHHPAASLPRWQQDGAALRLIAGQAYGRQAPVAFPAPIFYVAAELAAGAVLLPPDGHEERAVYLVDGDLTIDGAVLAPDQMAVLAPTTAPKLASASGARVMLLGGAALDAPRFLWWNFVASTPERLEAAKADWRDGRFAAVPGETEFIPLPES